MVLVKFFCIFEWLSLFFGNQNQADNERYERNSLGCLLKINDLGGTTLEKIDRLAWHNWQYLFQTSIRSNTVFSRSIRIYQMVHLM